MIRSFAVALIALVMLGGLAVRVQADTTSTSGTLTGTSTSTATSNPAVFDSSFTGSGVDSVSGPFAAANTGTITFTSLTAFLSSGTFVDTFSDGTIFGTFSGSGTETGAGATSITFVTLFTGGTGAFTGDTGESTVTGTTTAAGAFTGAYTGSIAMPEPSSLAFMLLGTGLVFVMRKRIGQGLP
jgi:PEP-CTERM motif-containing protein